MPISDKFRKSKSSGTMTDEGGWEIDDLMLPPDRGALFGGSQPRNTSGTSNSSDSSDEAKTSRKTSLLSPSLNSSSPYLPNLGPRSRSGSFSSIGFGGASGSSANAASFATLLKTTDTSRLDVAQVKRMRAVLSSESPVWISEFVEEGGYSAMVTRLKELLSLEWREEQHDDQLLHELLRCFIALSTTDVSSNSSRDHERIYTLTIDESCREVELRYKACSQLPLLSSRAFSIQKRDLVIFPLENYSWNC